MKTVDVWWSAPNQLPDVATPQNEGLLDSPNTRDRIINEHPYRGLGIPDDIARVALLFSEPLLWVTGVGTTCLDS